MDIDPMLIWILNHYSRRLVTEKLEERDELTVVILRIVDQLKKARVQLAKTQAKVMGKSSAIGWSS